MSTLKSAEHKFKAFFFRLFQWALKKRRGDFVPLDGRTVRKVLFLRPEKIGDMVISLPVFDGLKKHFPHITTAILASPKNYPLIKEDPRFDKIFLYRKNLWRDIREVLAMRRERFDCVIDMVREDSVTTLFLSQMLARGKPRIGIGKDRFQPYYDFHCDDPGDNSHHIIDYTLTLLNAFGIDSTTVSGYAAPYIGKDVSERAERVMNEVADGNKETLKIGLNLSAGAPTRLWQEEKSAELVARILNYQEDCVVILFAMPNDRRRAEQLRRRFTGRVHLIPEGTTLSDVSALISMLDVLITPDTSLVHIARSFRVPVVGLYSCHRKNFRLWRPYGQEVGAVVSPHDDNIFDITVDDVYDTFVQVMRQATPAVR
jgi:ADP-heptose:LPS heptosyltransferase